MKRALILALAYFTVSLVHSQRNYVAASISMGNAQTFEQAAYCQLEIGREFKNFTLAVAGGPSDLTGDPTSVSPWVEAKIQFSRPVGNLSSWLYFGGGQFIATDELPSRPFIDIGLGFSGRVVGPLSWSVGACHWAGSPYISFGPSVTF